MAEPISEKPRKKIVVHSLASFWWHVIKKSFKNACEPFEHLNSICALITGVYFAVVIDADSCRICTVYPVDEPKPGKAFKPN